MSSIKMYIWTLALKPFVDYPVGTSHCLKQTQKLDKPINKGLFRLLRVATFHVLVDLLFVAFYREKSTFFYHLRY